MPADRRPQVGHWMFIPATDHMVDGRVAGTGERIFVVSREDYVHLVPFVSCPRASRSNCLDWRLRLERTSEGGGQVTLVRSPRRSPLARSTTSCCLSASAKSITRGSCTRTSHGCRSARRQGSSRNLVKVW